MSNEIVTVTATINVFETYEDMMQGNMLDQEFEIVGHAAFDEAMEAVEAIASPMNSAGRGEIAYIAQEPDGEYNQEDGIQVYCTYIVESNNDAYRGELDYLALRLS